MSSFTHTTLAQRVLFGQDSAATNLEAEVKRLEAKSVMVIASSAERGLVDVVAAGVDVAAVYDNVRPHVPSVIVDDAAAVARANGIDLVVSIGGGSTTGLAKAVALRTRVQIIAVPTTYAGSEATNVWGITENARKTTGVDDVVLPASVIYDARLSSSLPVELSMVSGLNALAHCVDSMWAPHADPINRALAVEGIRVLNRALPQIFDDAGGAGKGRESALYGAYLSAVAFTSAGSGLHHKICHVLGGAYDLPHAHTHAIVLPYVLALLGPRVPEPEARMSAAFGSVSALDGLNTLRRRIDAPTALREHGFERNQIAEAIGLIRPVVPPTTPGAVTDSDLERLLLAAWAGEKPTAEMFSS